jgi:glutathione S-transferase
VCGESFTVADIVIGQLLYRWSTMEIERAENPVIEAYYKRLQQREAYRTHVMVPYDVLRAKGA